MDNFITVVGFCLGILIILCSVFVCSAPKKNIIKFIFNSIAGCIIISLFNIALSKFGFSAGINPITAVCVGIMGIPGALAVILLAVLL